MKQILLQICVLLIILFIVGCSSKQTQDPAPIPTQQEQSAETTDNEEWKEHLQGPIVDPTFSSTDEKVYTIETKYVNLSYPEKWQDKVRYETNDYYTYTVSFYGYAGALELPLFDLIFGESDEPMLGTLTKDSETIPVHIRNYDVENYGISEEDYEEWVAMCEDINVIIAELVSDYGFQITA